MGDITSTGNQTIWDEEALYSVGVTSDNELKIKGDVDVLSVPGYRLQTETDVTDKDFTDDTWLTIFDISGEGKPYYLHLEFYDGNFEIRVTMDGVVGFQMTNTEMGTHDLADGNQVRYQHNAPYKRSNDLVSWHFPESLSFNTSFKIEVRRRSGNGHGFDNGLLLWGVKY